MTTPSGDPTGFPSSLPSQSPSYHPAEMDDNECLYCLIKAVPIDYDNYPGDVIFDCLTDANGEVGIFAEIPYQIDLPEDFVEEHMAALQTGLSTICVPGGRAIRSQNSTLPDLVSIPEGAEIELFQSGQILDDENVGVGLGRRGLLVVRVSGSSESPVESVERLAGAVFGLGSEPLINSMRAQYGRCSFLKLDFTPASEFPELYNGVLDIELGYSLEGRNALGVLTDATASASAALGVDTLEKNFDYVMFCFARGTTLAAEGAEWSAFATFNGWKSVFNSNRCDKLSFLMHEIGHNLGLTHSAAGSFGQYEDTTGVVSHTFQTRFFVVCRTCISPIELDGLIAAADGI